MWGTKCTTEGRFSTIIGLCVQFLGTSSPDSVFLIWPSGCRKVGACEHKGLQSGVGHYEWDTQSDYQMVSICQLWINYFWVLVISLFCRVLFYFFVFENNLNLLCFLLSLFTLAYWQPKLEVPYPISFSAIFFPANHWVSLLLLFFCRWHAWCCL